MRIILTTLAVLIIAVLTTALVGPYFIDWSQHRVAIETQLSRALGLPVKLAGPIKAALLPTPYVTLADLSIGGDAKGVPIFSCRRARLELALAPLVRGEWRFTDATLDGVRIELQRSANGAIQPPPLAVAMAPESIGLDSILLRDATIAIAGADGAPPIAIEGLDLNAGADSLSGPFRGTGKAMDAGRAFTFHFATGALKDEALPIKFIADFGAAPHAEFDGSLKVGGAAPLSYAGAASFAGSAGATPWRLSGALKADLNGARFDELEATLGADERALVLQGSAEARFGAAPRVNARFAGKELNVDALLRDKGAESAPPERAAAALAALFSGAGAERGPPLPVSIKIDAPAIILGGDTIADAALEATVAPGEPVALKLQASGPGGARVSASGEIELGPAAHFKGPIEASVDDIDHLRDWLSEDDPDLHARLAAIGAALPYHSVSLAGDTDISGASFSARNATLTLARTALKGALTFTGAVGADRSRLFVDMKSDALDVDALPNFTAGGDVLSAVDLSVALEARALHVAPPGESALETGRLVLRLDKNGDDVTLDHVSIADLGGASLEADGAIKGAERWLNVDLDAARLRDFALLMRRIAPGAASEALLQRAGPLSPAKLSFNAKASGPAKDGVWAPDSLTMRGVVGATRVNARLDRAAGGGGLSASLSLDAPEVSALLRQLGVAAQPLTGLGRGVVSARADGDWSKGFSSGATASLAGADLSWSGRVGADAVLEGAVKLKAANVLPLLAALGTIAPDPSQGAAADLSAGVTWRDGEIALSRLKGGIARANVLGDLVYRLAAPDASGAAPPAQIEGALSLDRLALGGLASLALGPPPPVKAGAVWSDAKFSPALANPPIAAVALKIAALNLTNDLVARDATLTLKVRPGLVAFEDLTMHVAGGTASGAATLRRDGANAALSGKIALNSIALDRPGLAANIAGSMDFASTGQSAAALVTGLAGSGVLQLSGAQIPRLDPDALSRIVASAQKPDFDIEQIDLVRLLARELDRHAMQIVDASAPASLTAGVLRAGPFQARRANGDAEAQVSFDLRSMNLDFRVGVGERQAPKFWSAAPPTFAVSLRGPPDALTRDIDAAALANGLEAQTIARESARIADMEADIRERAAFNRVLKASRFMRQRELELDAYAADQARLKSEADRRRVEAETLKASEEARKAQEDARKAEEERKAQEEARKASELAPPLPADVGAPTGSTIIAPAAVVPTAPTPPPRPTRPPASSADPAASGIY